MVRNEELLALEAAKIAAGLVEKDISKKDVAPVEFVEKKGQIPNVDKNTGVFSCPECHEVFNSGCRNCFHSRFKGEDPFQPNSEVLINYDEEK